MSTKAWPLFAYNVRREERSDLEKQNLKDLKHSHLERMIEKGACKEKWSMGWWGWKEFRYYLLRQGAVEGWRHFKNLPVFLSHYKHRLVEPLKASFCIPLPWQLNFSLSFGEDEQAKLINCQSVLAHAWRCPMAGTSYIELCYWNHWFFLLGVLLNYVIVFSSTGISG